MGSACVLLEVISTSSTALINCISVLIVSIFSMSVPQSIVTSAAWVSSSDTSNGVSSFSKLSLVGGVSR